jgi:hypothetical protein
MPGLISPEPWSWLTLARAALEAAERVRPRETSTERTRRHRAKGRAAGNVPANVPSVGNVREADGWNVSSPARLMDKIESQVNARPAFIGSAWLIRSVLRQRNARLRR